jgi:hypothetical protein
LHCLGGLKDNILSVNYLGLSSPNNCAQRWAIRGMAMWNFLKKIFKKRQPNVQAQRLLSEADVCMLVNFNTTLQAYMVYIEHSRPSVNKSNRFVVAAFENDNGYNGLFDKDTMV